MEEREKGCWEHAIYV